MKIKIWKDPYDTGSTLTLAKEIELKQGLSVIVGCNGSGKTTLIQNIKEELTESKVPHLLFDNLQHGKSSSIGAILGGYREFEIDTTELGVSLWTASEGEAIKINVGRQSTLYREFIKTGIFKNQSYKFKRLFDQNEEKLSEDKRRVFLFDATDSGLSVDSICELKNLFAMVLKDALEQNTEPYIIITANEYEMCRNEQCLDVTTGQYIKFKDYEEYRTFILQSRKKKDERIIRESEYRKNEYEKEKKQYLALKERNLKKISEIKEKAEKEGRQMIWKERSAIEKLESQLEDFLRL